MTLTPDKSVQGKSAIQRKIDELEKDAEAINSDDDAYYERIIAKKEALEAIKDEVEAETRAAIVAALQEVMAEVEAKRKQCEAAEQDFTQKYAQGFQPQMYLFQVNGYLKDAHAETLDILQHKINTIKT
jgi:hypothetical protein